MSGTFDEAAERGIRDGGIGRLEVLRDAGADERSVRNEIFATRKATVVYSSP